MSEEWPTDRSSLFTLHSSLFTHHSSLLTHHSSFVINWRPLCITPGRMRRHRFLFSLLCLAGMAALMYAIASLYLPSPRWMVLGVDQRSGRVRTVESHVTFLPPAQFYRLRFEKRTGGPQRD